VEFWRSSALVYRHLGLYGMAEKIWDFLETFPPEGAKCFYRGLFKGSLEIFQRSYRGAT